MKFKYGSYIHAANQVAITATQEIVRNEAGEPIINRHVWTLIGDLSANGASDITSEVVDLETAYGQQVNSAGLYHDDGTTRTHLYWDASRTIGGIRPTLLQFPRGDGMEYVNVRTFMIMLEAEFPAVNDSLVSFQESLTYQGMGGPRLAIHELRNGPPRIYMVSNRTPIVLVQQGQAIGLFSYPVPPYPIIPAFSNSPSAGIVRGTPRLRQSRYTDWPINWKYEMLLTSPVDLYPNKFPRR